MATYSIRTNRTQEIGLKFSYDHYANKDMFPTQEAWLQSKVNEVVTNPMYADQVRANSIAFDQSFNTIPVAEQPTAKTEMETVITSHGGTIIAPGPIGPPTPTGVPGGVISPPGGTDSSEIQAGEES